MSTAMIEAKPAKDAILFSVTEATVRPMVEKYLAMTISGVEDKVGIAAVRTARQEVRKARTTVDKERESAKRFYLEEGRKIDAVAKQLWATMEPAELHLVAELERIDAENQRLADEKLDRRLAIRMDDLQGAGGIHSTVASQFPMEVVRAMTDEGFTAFLKQMADLNERMMLEAKQLAEAEEQNRLERERIAEERAELDRLRKAEAERQQAEQKRLAEERRFEDERLSAQRAAESKVIEEQRAEQRRIAAEEQKKLDEQRAAQEMEAARIETERKKLADEQAARQRDADAAALAKQNAEAAERQRLEDEKTRVAMLPHKEKVIAYRDSLMAVVMPKLPAKLRGVTDLLEDLRMSINERLTNMAESVEKSR